MHYSNAVSAIARAQAGGTPTIDFVSPAVSALLSAWALADRDAAARIGFGSACAGYAANIGLTGVLSGNPIPETTNGERCGRSYTPLASLCTHAEVDHCNALINSVLRKQLEQHAPDLVKRVSKVIGELHDNIASHACGRGYSAAQTYESGKPRIEFAIADCGRGLRRNAREVDPHIGSDSEAIEWAFAYGNTSARPADPWAQRGLEGDCDGREDGDDHHQGIGLWELAQLVTATGGRVWVATGEASQLLTGGRWVKLTPVINWPGLAIELEIPLDSDAGKAKIKETGLEGLAEELGL